MGDCEFRLATAEEEAEAKEHEEPLRASAQAWSCNHCTQFLRSDAAGTQDDVLEHLLTQ